MFPKSGPSDGKGGDIVFNGAGFRKSDKPLCKLNGTVYSAKSHTENEIRCEMRSAVEGKDFFGNVQIEVSVNGGAEWHQIPEGFQYYQQPVVQDIWPKRGPGHGIGVINFYGYNFRADYVTVDLKCKIGKSVGVAFYVSPYQIKCVVEDIEEVEDG